MKANTNSTNQDDQLVDQESALLAWQSGSGGTGLPSNHETLFSIPSTTHKKKKISMLPGK
jgi:hypothetical protein